DLTGGGRQNLDFLLGKIFDPSAAVSADFRMSVLNLKDGRVLNGIVTAKTERTLTLKTTTDSLTVQLGDIDSTTESALSLMPDGMLEGLTVNQVRDLVAYLMDKNQAPASKRKQLLVWADTRSVSAPYGAQHKSVPHAAAIIEKLGKDKDLYDTTIQTDSKMITKRATGEGAKDLRSFDAIFFIGMRELGISNQQKADLEAFIKEDGKGFVAAHTATTAFMSWPEFGQILGGRFDGHPWGITKAPVILEDPNFPATKHFPAVFTLNEEFYQTKDFSRDKIRVLLRLDASKLPNNKNINRKDGDFPLAWVKAHGKGRVFYSALGHANEAWDNPDLQTMWLEAIKWSMGMTDADVTPRPLVKKTTARLR
ncbi:MAG TPA: ThuA domain-containing protein, partial [Gemmataceae bacterium]|nr:ThuA domain-containing protein [Gemmataceae bacterium]